MADRRLHIALFLPAMNDGGAERVYGLLGQGFLNAGHRVDFVLLKNEGPFLKEIPADAGLFHIGHKAWALFRLVKYLRARQPDILMPATPGPGTFAVLAKLVARRPVKVVATVHGMISGNRRTAKTRKWKFVLLLWKVLVRRTDGVIAVSKAAAREIAVFGRIDQQKIHVIYNPIIDETLYRKAEKEVFHPFLASKSCPVILWAGRFREPKDPHTLLRAFADSLNAGPKKLLLLGEGPLRHSLEALADELGISEHLSMPGFVDNPYPYMRQADVLVLSSHFEAFGNVLVEAMALGTPVIATDCPGGSREALAYGEYGILVPPGDIGAMVQAIAASLKTSEEKKNKAREWAQSFSVTSATQNYLKHMQNILKEA